MARLLGSLSHTLTPSSRSLPRAPVPLQDPPVAVAPAPAPPRSDVSARERGIRELVFDKFMIVRYDPQHTPPNESDLVPSPQWSGWAHVALLVGLDTHPGAAHWLCTFVDETAEQQLQAFQHAHRQAQERALAEGDDEKRHVLHAYFRTTSAADP